MNNPHYAEAQKSSDFYNHRNVSSDAEVIGLGQLEAVLALAFEQRTANLIAYVGINPAALTEGIEVEIRERLGMDPHVPVDVSKVAEVQEDHRCNLPLMDGRNEIRCWLPANHDGGCK